VLPEETVEVVGCLGCEPSLIISLVVQLSMMWLASRRELWPEFLPQ